MSGNLYNSIARSSLLSIVAAASSYLVIVLLARMLSQEAFAEYLYVVAWGMIAALVIDCAAEQCLVHFARSTSMTMETAWRTVCVLKVAVLTGLTIVALGVRASAYGETPLLALLMLVPAFYMGPIFEARGRNIEYATIICCEKIAFLAIALLLAQASVAVSSILVAYFAISVCSLVAQAGVLRVMPQGRIAKPSTAWPRYIATYAPIYLILVSQLFYGNISRIVVEAKLGVIAFASISLALQVVNAISMIQSQVDRHLRPIVIAVVQAGDMRTLKDLVKRHLRLYLLPLAVGCALISLWASEIVRLLFGARWEHAGDVLRIASPLMLTIACMRLIDVLVVALGEGRMNLAVNLASAGLLFAALWWNPTPTNILSYVAIILLLQSLHVTTMAVYLHSCVRRSVS